MPGFQTQVLLIAPQMFSLLEGFSAGLVALANYSGRRHPEAEISLLDLSDVPNIELKERLESSLNKASMHVVGITTTTASYQSALRIARHVRELRPHATIVLGGHHASADARLIVSKHRNVINGVIVGEGERALDELITHAPNLALVPNAVYWDGQTIQMNPTADALTTDELDEIAVDFENEMFVRPGKFDHVTYVSARGCPLKCSFCAVANQSIRAKSVGAVIRDLKHLCDLGFKHIAIEDNFFAQNIKRTQELCHAMITLREKTGVHFDWDCQTRVESIRSRELAELMKDAGCSAVYLGVESLIEEHLVYLGKTPNPSHYLHVLQEKVVPILIETGLDCYINLQVGLPGESDEHQEASIRRLAVLGQIADKLEKRITVFPMLHVVYPGTRHFEMALEKKVLLPTAFEKFTKWEEREAPIKKWMGDQFAHGTGGIPLGILKSNRLPNRFQIDPNSVVNVARYLRAMDVPGVRVFSYGKFLVQGKA